MGQKTADAMVQSQYDCMVVRACQETYVEAKQSVQCWTLEQELLSELL